MYAVNNGGEGWLLQQTSFFDLHMMVLMKYSSVKLYYIHIFHAS